MNSHISIFQNFSSRPVTISLLRWLKACKSGDSRYVSKIEQYRETGDPEFKKSLPLATVGAVCEGGRKLGNVVSRTGWIALDIDAKDNPHLSDAEHLRDEIAKISNVAFSGLSASGAGVWCLVKVENPNRQADHFEMLLTDFERFGITLDSSKGRNPNDARFYSYDPGAIIKDSCVVYEKLPPRQKKPNSAPIRPGNASRYAEAAFTDELQILSEAQKGNRNNQLFKSSASLASLVAGGMLNKYEVQQALKETARSLGLKDFEINATVSSGFEHGFSNPRTPDSNRTNTTRQGHEQARDKPLEPKFESQHSATDRKINQLKQLDPIVAELMDGWGAEIENPEELELTTQTQPQWN